MHQLFFGDCIEVMSDIKPVGVDMIFADLPYGTTKCKWDSPISLLDFWVQALKIIKDNGAIVMTAQTPFDKVLGASNLKMLRYEWIWEKTQATGHLNAKKAPMKAHENILVFYKNLPTYNPQKTSGHVRKVSTAHHKRNSRTGNGYGKSDNHRDYDSTERYPRSVIRFASDKQKMNLHEAQKPLALIEYIIKTYSNPGDLILDPCMGSGTTGVACANLGRRFIGIENDEKYFKVAKGRVLAAYSQIMKIK